MTGWRREARDGAKADKPRHLPLQPALTLPLAPQGGLRGQMEHSHPGAPDGTLGPSDRRLLPVGPMERASPCTRSSELSCDQGDKLIPMGGIKTQRLTPLRGTPSLLVLEGLNSELTPAGGDGRTVTWPPWPSAFQGPWGFSFGSAQ